MLKPRTAKKVKKRTKANSKDKVLELLSVPAHPLPIVKPTKKNRHTSSFFFTLEDEDLNDRKLAVKKVEPPSSYKPIDVRIDSYSKELPEYLEDNIVKVREFILQTLSPLFLAADTGSRQALEIISKSLNSPVDSSSLTVFEDMLKAGYSIKVSNFLIKYLGLSKKDTELLLKSIIKGPVNVSFPSLNSIQSEPLVRNNEKDKNSRNVLPGSPRNKEQEGRERKRH